MKRYLFIIILFVCAAVPMTAQYYSVNYDKRTVAEMTAALLHRELLLPTHLQHGLRQDYAQDLDCGRHDVA